MTVHYNSLDSTGGGSEGPKKPGIHVAVTSADNKPSGSYRLGFNGVYTSDIPVDASGDEIFAAITSSAMVVNPGALGVIAAPLSSPITGKQYGYMVEIFVAKDTNWDGIILDEGMNSIFSRPILGVGETVHDLHLAVDDNKVEGAAIVTDMQVVPADRDASFDTVNIVVSEFVTTLDERVITSSFEVCCCP